MLSERQVPSKEGLNFAHQVGVYGIVAFIAAISYVAVLSWLTVWKYEAFRTSAWDLGIYNQALYNTLFSKRFFFYTPELFANPTGYLFVAHFSPILIALLPIYLLSPTPQTLLVVQSALLGLAAIPLFAFVRRETGDPRVALVFSLLYLSNPYVHSINWYDFHVEAFLPMLVFMSFYFRSTRRMAAYLLTLLLLASVIEQAGVIVAMIGFTHLLVSVASRGKRLTGRREFALESLPLILGILWIVFSLRYIYSFPHSRGPTGYFSAIGSDLYSLPWSIVRDPARILLGLSYEWRYKLLYWIGAFATLGFVPIAGGVWLLPALPWLVASLLSNYRPFYAFGYQYPGFMIPFLFIAATHGFSKLGRGRNGALRRPHLILVGLVAGGALLGLAMSPFSLVWPKTSDITENGLFFNYGFPYLDNRDKLRNAALALIPDSASVLSTAQTFPRLSSRLRAYAVRPYSDLLFQSESSYTDYLRSLLREEPDYILVDLNEDPFGSGEVIALLAAPPWKDQYGVLGLDDGLVLYKKGHAGAPVSFEGAGRSWDLSVFLPYATAYSGGERLQLRGSRWTLNGTTLVGPVERGRILFHPAPGAGVTEIRYPFRSFHFTKGKLTYALEIPGAAVSNGVRFSMWVEFSGAWRRPLVDRTVLPGTDVTSVDLDLSELAGRSFVLVLVAESLGDVAYDWLTITLSLR